MEFIVHESCWMKYADIVGDDNVIHRDNEAARKAGLEKVIAPGMWLVSHVQGNSKIQNAEFAFKGSAYNGDFVKERNGSFYREDDLLSKGSVILGEPTGNNISLPEGIYLFS